VALQGVGVTEPGGHTEPGGQGVHRGVPGLGAYVPPGQGLHTPKTTPPVLEKLVPGRQGVGAVIPRGQKLPAGQRVQKVDPLAA
jgi:hypothetical protein